MGGEGELLRLAPSMRLVLVTVLALAAGSAAFKVGGKPSPKRAVSPKASSVSPKSSAEAEGSLGAVQGAWARFVLLRPGMSQEELKTRTRRPTPRQYSLDPAERTPGTVRTILLSSFLVFLAALPALLANPVVLAKLIELAALDIAGVTPMEMYKQTGWFW